MLVSNTMRRVFDMKQNEMTINSKGTHKHPLF
jgi:hypothetical protein